jgi:tRNA-dihydrouridine synthase
VPGTLSVKTRTGIDDPREIFTILPAFESAGIDFLVVHSRTVKQKYAGHADHELTREMVASTSLPLIANGDIRDERGAASVLESTGAAGLMLGRGAVADPLIFERIRGNLPPRPLGEKRKREVALYLKKLLEGYVDIFWGDAQVLAKLREVLAHVDDPDLARWVKALKKQKAVDGFAALLEA